jgi:large conductance mechanosensitive channel
MQEFKKFIEEQGVMGLAIGFILGAAVKDLVNAFVTDLVYPFLNVILGSTEGLAQATLTLGIVTVPYGHFIKVFIDFIVIALVVFYVFKGFAFKKIKSKKKK